MDLKNPPIAEKRPPPDDEEVTDRAGADADAADVKPPSAPYRGS